MVNAQGRVVIPPAYDALWPFSQGLAAFSFDKKWGFINEQNTVVISNRYDRVNSFLEDRTTVMTQEEGGIIDKQGQLAAPLRRQLKELGPLYADRAAFKDPAKDLWGMLTGMPRLLSLHSTIRPEYLTEIREYVQKAVDRNCIRCIM